MATWYWVGGSGDISAPTGHLSTTSGGTSTGTSLAVIDNLIFDNNSGAGAIEITQSALTTIASLTTTARTTSLTLSMSSSLYVNSDCLLGNSTYVNTGFSGYIGFESASAVRTVTFGTTLHDASIRFYSGATTLGSEIKTNNYLDVDYSTANSSTFNTQGYNITSGRVYLSCGGSNTMDLSTTIWTIKTKIATAFHDNGGVGITATNAELIIDDSVSTQTTHEIIISGSYKSISFQGTGVSNTFRILNAGTVPSIGALKILKQDLAVKFATNFNLEYLQTPEVPGHLTAFSSTVNGIQVTITGLSATLGNPALYTNYISIRDINTGTTRFYAGANSTNLGNNGANVLFSSVPATKVLILTSASASDFRVPFDWNSSDNTIEVVSAGANGDQGLALGWGGGGGAYCKVSNVALVQGSMTNYRTPNVTPLEKTYFGDTGLAASISGTTLTVSAASRTPIRVGTYILGAAEGTRVVALGTGTGYAGTYTVNISQTASPVGPGFICAAENGKGGISSGIGGLASASFGEVKFSGGNGTNSAGGGGGAAGPNGAGGDSSTGVSGTANGGLVAGVTNGTGAAGLTSTIWTSINGVTVGVGSGGGGGNDLDISGGAGGSRGGGGGGDLTNNAGVGSPGVVVVTYTTAGAPHPQLQTPAILFLCFK